MPTDEEVWMEEEISYEQHIENMDRIRDERIDVVRARERNEELYRAYVEAMGHYGQSIPLMTSTDGVNSMEPEKPKKNLIGGKLL